jgi:hypothetical protein
MVLPVYSRADLSRAVTPVVALSLTAVWTGGVARAFDAAEPDRAGAIDLDRSNGATIGSEPPFALEPWRLVGFHTKAQHDAAAALLIEPTRKVE